MIREYASGQRFFEDVDGVVTIDAIMHDSFDTEVCIDIVDGARGDRGMNLAIHLDRATLSGFITELLHLRDQLPQPDQTDNQDKENEMSNAPLIKEYDEDLARILNSCMRCNLVPATRLVTNELPGATTHNELCDACVLAVVMLTINDAMIKIAPLYTDEPQPVVDNWDTTSWQKARDGDYIKLTDPNARDLTIQYVIDGCPVNDMAAGTTEVYCREVFNGDLVKDTGGRRIFNHACWQVWHDFNRVD